MGHVIAVVFAAGLGLVLLAATAVWLSQIVAIPLRAVREVLIERDRQKCPTCGGIAVKITGGLEHVHARTATHECERGHIWASKYNWPKDQPGTDFMGMDSRSP